jgi:hypothetical protein
MINYDMITVDTTCFAERKSIIELIIVNMFAYFQENYDSVKNSDSTYFKNQFFINVQKVFENCKIKTGDYKLDEELGCESTLQTLAKLASATNVKRNLQEAIKSYLKFFGNKTVLTVNIINMSNCKHTDYYHNEIQKYLADLEEINVVIVTD